MQTHPKHPIHPTRSIHMQIFSTDFETGMKKIEKKLFEREKSLDTILAESRKIIRACSNTIKALHAHDFKEAETNLQEAEKGLADLGVTRKEFPDHLHHILQEYVEARVVFSAVKNNKIPAFDDLEVPEVSYLTGLLDAIGELKREMYEALRKSDKKSAEKYFAMMEAIYDALLPLRFSNSVLPEFRKKQDVGRIQIEQARGQLI